MALPPKEPPEPITGAPLWTLTLVLVALAGVMFFFVRVPLAQAFDALLPEAILSPAAPEPEVPEVETPPPPPPPTEPEAPQWNLADIETALAAASDAAVALLDEGRSELPTYEDLGAADASGSALQVQARWRRWGRVWHNRVDVHRQALPPVESCRPHAEMEPRCAEVHAILDAIDAIAESGSYEAAETRLEAAAERLELYRNPPVEEELDENGEPIEAESEAEDSDQSEGPPES